MYKDNILPTYKDNSMYMDILEESIEKLQYQLNNVDEISLKELPEILGLIRDSLVEINNVLVDLKSKESE